QRQSSTLSQELAIALLFPAAMFLLDAIKVTGTAIARTPPVPRHLSPVTYHWIGFIACTAAIAATHSGVLIPLVILCAIIGATSPKDIWRGALAGLAGILIGSTWLLGFIAYPFVSANTKPGGTALFYFPFLRHFADG